MTSYENLSDELKVQLKERYPDGFTDHMTRVDKPNGDFFYGVVLETQDTIYFVKISVKIDDKTQEDIEKDIFAPSVDEVADLKGAEEIADTSDQED
ncbi:MAG: hypothetical protein R3Y61_06250 [Rikenellaceae bacterium]